MFSGPDMHYTYPNGDGVSNIDIVYLCREWDGEMTPQVGEVEELCFFSAADLPDALMPPNIRPLRLWQKQKMS